MKLCILPYALESDGPNTVLFRKLTHTTTTKCDEFLRKWTRLVVMPRPMGMVTRTLVALPEEQWLRMGLLAWLATLSVNQPSTFPSYLPALERRALVRAAVSESIQKRGEGWWDATHLRKAYAMFESDTQAAGLQSTLEADRVPPSHHYLLHTTKRLPDVEVTCISSAVLDPYWRTVYQEAPSEELLQWVGQVRFRDGLRPHTPEPTQREKEPKEPKEPPVTPAIPKAHYVSPQMPRAMSAPAEESLQGTLLSALQAQQNSYLALVKEMQQHHREVLASTAEVMTRHHTQLMREVLQAFQKAPVEVAPPTAAVPPTSAPPPQEPAAPSYEKREVPPPVKELEVLLPNEDATVVARSWGFVGFVPFVAFCELVRRRVTEKYPQLLVKESRVLDQATDLTWGRLTLHRLLHLMHMSMAFWRDNVKHFSHPDGTSTMFVRRNQVGYIADLFSWWFDDALSSGMHASVKLGEPAKQMEVDASDYAKRAKILQRFQPFSEILERRPKYIGEF